MKLNYKYPLQKSETSEVWGVFIFSYVSLQGFGPTRNTRYEKSYRKK